MSTLALITGSPFIFPSLGPTAFLFFYTPRAPSASPRYLVGHTSACWRVTSAWLSRV